MTPTIGFIAHVGMHNMGDEVLFASALQHFRRRFPKGRFVGFTVGREDSLSRHGLDAVHPIRPERTDPDERERVDLWTRVRDRVAPVVREVRFSAECIRRVRGMDMLVVPGSSQFIDAYGGPWGFPLTLARWTMVARVARVPICFLSLGAEPLTHSASQWLVRRTVAAADFVSVRDPVSVDRLRSYGVSREIPIAPDLAFGYVAGSDGETPTRSDGFTIGINPVPYFHPAYWRASDDARYRAYIETLTGVAAHVLGDGGRVVLYATQEWSDQLAAGDIHEALGRRVGAAELERVTRPPVRTIDELWKVLGGLDAVIASRYHGVATALSAHKPVIGIAYEQKTTDLMDTMGLAEYSPPIESVTTPMLTDLLARVRQHEESVLTAIRLGVERSRSAVRDQFDEVADTYLLRQGS